MFDAEVLAVRHVCRQMLTSPYHPSGHTAIQYFEFGSANDPPVHVPTHFVVLFSAYGTVASHAEGMTQSPVEFA